VLLAERRDPAAAFTGTTRAAPWDELQAAYFAGEANWNYFVAPFIFARADFTAEETEPWHEDGQTWRTLLVTYPDTIVAHHRQQTYYFDAAGSRPTAFARCVPVNDANPRTGATRSNTKFQQRHSRFELHTELAQLAHDDFGRTLVRVGS
jgi:hypothetical protein